MQTLKKLAVTIGLLALAFSLRAQPVPVKVGSLVPVTVAQPNALLLLTIPGVTNYVISVANFQTQIGGGSTNFSITIATGLTNLIYNIGAGLTSLVYNIGGNTTNYVNGGFTANSNFTYNSWLSLSNVDYSVFIALSNVDILSFQSVSNYANSLWTSDSNFTYNAWLSNSNYTDIASSNRVTVAAGANINVSTNGSGGVMTYTVSSPGSSTNYSVVISGTNTYVEVTTTNNTNFYKVNSTATGGGGGSVTNITNATLYGFTNVSQIVWFTNALSELDSNIFICPSNGPIQWLEFTNGWLFMNATNLEFEWSGNHINMEVWLKPKQFAVDRTIVLNPNWHMFSGARTNLIFSNKLAILRLRKTGTNETDIMASWEPEL